MKRRLSAIGISLFIIASSYCQHTDSAIDVVDKIANLPGKFLSSIQRKTNYLDEQLTKQTEKYLRNLAKKEEKIKKKLCEADPAAAKQAFAAGLQYDSLAKKIKTDAGAGSNAISNSGEYLPYVDSLQTSLNFLDKNPQLLNSPKQIAELQQTLASLQQLRAHMQDAAQAQQYIQARKQQLKQSIDQSINGSVVGKYLDEYKKSSYYYSEQVREYKESLNDPDKILQKALVLLNKLPAFQNFIKQNGMLAGLFSVPGNYGTSQALVGLQTRDQVQQLIQAQISSGGPNAMGQLQSSLETAHAQLDQLKDKLSKLGAGSNDMDMPGFKPNPQKTKSFLKRIEFGTNIQTTRTTYYFPTVTDFALTAGYKLNGNSTIGIGGSYKLGWGSGINHINFTSEGLGLRSFVDVRLKKSFFASGGFEYNYEQHFASLNQLRSMYDWSRSGLLGISKIVSLNGKLIKKTKVQLLWDFLSYSQRPQTTPIKFRVGYNF